MSAQPTPLPQVAFIGTGLMGRPMVRRLLGGGVAVTVFNRSPGPMEELEQWGATRAGSAAQAVQQAEVVITMLPNGDVVGAQAGTLAIMVGGNQVDFQRAAPLFGLLGRPTLVGPHGAGQLCKLVNQAIVAVTLGAVAEELSLARAGGADPVRVREATMGGFAQSRILELHGQRMNERRSEPGGTITNQVKDLGAVLDMAAGAGVKLPLIERVHELFGSVRAAGQGGLDHSALILEIERRLPPV